MHLRVHTAGLPSGKNQISRVQFRSNSGTLPEAVREGWRSGAAEAGASGSVHAKAAGANATSWPWKLEGMGAAEIGEESGVAGAAQQ